MGFIDTAIGFAAGGVMLAEALRFQEWKTDGLDLAIFAICFLGLATVGGRALVRNAGNRFR